jgi:hypothetical protein
MQMTVLLDPNFHYSAEMHEFPVEIEITSDIPIEISYPVDVTGALLTKIGNDEASFGYVMRVTPARRPVIMLLPEKPLQMRVNVFENDEDFSDYNPGIYQCEIKVSVNAVMDNGSRNVELRESFTVEVH